MKRKHCAPSVVAPVLILVASFLLSCTAGTGHLLPGTPGGEDRGNLTGRFTFEGEPVAGADVYLTGEYPPSTGGPVYATRSDKDGYFSLDVPPGRYYIHGKKGGETGIFAFSGQNPLDLGDRSRFVGLKGVKTRDPYFEKGDEEGGAISGRVLHLGKPVQGAFVNLYSDDSSLYKGPGVAVSPPTDGEGSFTIENLVETDYLIIGRMRSDGSMTGPLRAGDLYCFHPANPVPVREGKVLRVDLQCVEKEKEVSYAEVTSGSGLSVSGFVVDRVGTPVEGVYAFLYDTRVFGHKRPYSHSGKTGEDGRFTVHVDRPGTYYLGAREVFGNTPRPGERFGFYNGTPDHSIRVEEGTPLVDLVIVAGRILEGDEGTGKEPLLEERVFDRGMPVRAIREDTTLTGEVTVEGIMVVPKGVSLTILPGTSVKFKRIDVDGDGIGDGELYVEGRVVVKGTREHPVIFTSAEPDPAAKDWKYFFVNLSPGSSFEYLISEYAFSGLQIHFSRAEVKNCTFRHNVDGLRFSTVRGVFEGNLMTGNVYGVRYEERATDAALRGNLITGNRVGIFSVLESKGGLKIEGNNVEHNGSYNFKLGNRQVHDLPVSGNWWGSSLGDEIEEAIFDGSDAPGLGRVLFRPFSKEPFEAGPK